MADTPTVVAETPAPASPDAHPRPSSAGKPDSTNAVARPLALDGDEEPATPHMLDATQLAAAPDNGGAEQPTIVPPPEAATSPVAPVPADASPHAPGAPQPMAAGHTASGLRVDDSVIYKSAPDVIGDADTVKSSGASVVSQTATATPPGEAATAPLAPQQPAATGSPGSPASPDMARQHTSPPEADAAYSPTEGDARPTVPPLPVPAAAAAAAERPGAAEAPPPDTPASSQPSKRSSSKSSRSRSSKRDKKDSKRSPSADVTDVPIASVTPPESARRPPREKKDKKDKRTKALRPPEPAPDKENTSGSSKPSNASVMIHDAQSESLSHQGPDLMFTLSGVQMVPDRQETKLAVHVRHMGPLTANPEITHPFLRVWLVDAATGQSLARDPSGAAMCVFSHPFDLKSHQTTSPAWDEVLVLDVNDAIVDAQQPMVILELLDFGQRDISGQPIQRKGLFRIASGFLMLTDMYGRSNLERTCHVQLFRDSVRRGRLRKLLVAGRSVFAPTPQSKARMGFIGLDEVEAAAVPPVFHEMRSSFNRNDVYAASVAIECFAVQDTYSPPSPQHLTLYEQHLMNKVFVELQSVQPGTTVPIARAVVSNDRAADKGRRGAAKELERRRHAELLTKDFTRRRGERSLPPNQSLHEIRINEAVSHMVLSPDGNVLAVAVVADFVGSVRMYHVFSHRADLVGHLRGHVDYIHHVAYSKDGKRLLSCGADKTVRVWNVSNMPCIVSTSLDEQTVCEHTLHHGSHVYSAEFLNNFVVSCGFDAKVYLWSLSTGTLVVSRDNPVQGFFRQVVVGPHSASSHKVWTLDTLGFLSAWRAKSVDDESPNEAMPAVRRSLTLRPQDLAVNYTTIEARRRLQVPGATRVHVGGNVAVLYVPSAAPTFVVMDLVSYQIVRSVHVGQLPPSLRIPPARIATELTSDAKIVMLGFSSTAVLAFDVQLGELFTPAHGYNPGLKTKLPVTHMACSPVHHLTVVATEPPLHAQGAVLHVVARPRAIGEECSEHDAMAANTVRHLFGGEIKLKATAGPNALATRAALHMPLGATMGRSVNNASMASLNNTPRVLPRGRREELREPRALTDVQARIGQIIGWWKARADKANERERSRSPQRSSTPPAGAAAVPVPHDEL